MSYKKRLAAKLAAMNITSGHVTVVHQDNCPRLAGGNCRCDFRVEAGPPPQFRQQAKNAANN